MSRRVAAASLRIREIVAPDDRAVRDAHRLLRTAFSRRERVPLAEWRATLQERARGVWTDYAWHLLVAEQRGRVLGLATGTYLGNVNIGVIGYLAIDASVRAAGLGTRLRRRLRAAFMRDARITAGRELAGILGEVSPDNPWLDSLARKQGVLVLDVPYFQPRLYPGDKPSPFVLYYESIGGTRRWLSATEVRRILYAIWRRAYRISRPLERPAFRRMLRSLEGRNRIGSAPAYRRRTR
jgi:hypothetical protein